MGSPEPFESTHSPELQSRSCLRNKLLAIEAGDLAASAELLGSIDDEPIGEGLTSSTLACENCGVGCVALRTDDWQIIDIDDAIIGPTLQKCPELK